MKMLKNVHLLIWLLFITHQTVYANNKPVFTSSPGTNIREFQTYEYLISATDNDNDSIIFVCLVKPEWLSFTIIDKANSKLTGSAINFKDSVLISLLITDGMDTSFQSFYLHFVPNSPPVFLSSQNVITTYDLFFNFNIIAEDQDKDSLRFFVEKLPGWLSFEDKGNDTAIIKGTASYNEPEWDTVVICVTDFVDTVKQNIKIMIGCYPESPVITSFPDTVITVANEYTYLVSANSLGGNEDFVFSCPGLPSWLSYQTMDNNSLLISGTPSENDIGVHPVSIECKYEGYHPCYTSTFQYFKLWVTSKSSLNSFENKPVIQFESQSDEIILKFTNIEQIHIFKMIDVYGKSVLKMEKFNNNEIIINKGNYISGVYILYLISTDLKCYSYKIII